VRRPRGLRVRLILALLATSLVTLAGSIATLVPPLEHRLESDRLNELRVLARTARFGIRQLPAAVLREGSPSVRSLVAGLQRRTGGRVELLAADGAPLADTDVDRDSAPIGGLQRIRDLRLARVSDVREGVVNGTAIVVTGVRRPDGGRLILVLRKPLNDTRAAVGAVRDAVPPALAVGGAVALLMALALSRGLLLQLRQLRDDARALGSDGLRHTIQVGRRDEVGEVAGALEAMRARLVGEEDARQAFVATASHELRTPLATLQATLELMQEDLRAPPGAPVDRAALEARAEAALLQTHRLAGLATDLLDLNRVDGEVPLGAEPIELFEAAAMLRREVSDRLDADGRALEVAGAAPQHALADPAAVLRILLVLLDNAYAYGAGTVRLHISGDDGGRALVRVTDEGPGLSITDREHVFERFERGEAGRTQPGFGLGLAIARGLAERMGGSLHAPLVASGGCFELRLPAWQEAAGSIEDAR
jgi:signal transduction histidine kinase